MIIYLTLMLQLEEKIRQVRDLTSKAEELRIDLVHANKTVQQLTDQLDHEKLTTQRLLSTAQNGVNNGKDSEFNLTTVMSQMAIFR